ncbi:MAG: hypothetical protein Q9180_004712, partial [Flavoplaca navasiana]
MVDPKQEDVQSMQSRLHTATEAYRNDQNKETLRQMLWRQNEFNKLMRSPKALLRTKQIDSQHLEAFVVSFVMGSQETFASNDLKLLRHLPRQRGLKLRPGRLLTEIELTNTVHLEIAAAHIVGEATTAP